MPPFLLYFSQKSIFACIVSCVTRICYIWKWLKFTLPRAYTMPSYCNFLHQKCKWIDELFWRSTITICVYSNSILCTDCCLPCICFISHTCPKRHILDHIQYPQSCRWTYMSCYHICMALFVSGKVLCIFASELIAT